MPSLRGGPALGPDRHVTPTNRLGQSNAEDAPTFVSTATGQRVLEAHRYDINVQTLVELRVLSKLIVEAFGMADELDQLRTDEELALGLDMSS